MAIREYIQYTKDGFKITKHCYSLAALKGIGSGTIALQADGVAYPLVSGLDFQALTTKIAGADQNGDIQIYASNPNVRFSIVDPNANNATLKVRVNTNVPGFIEVIVLSATGNAGALTSTANDVVDAIKAHATASKYITARVVIGGTGASLVVATAPTSIKYISVLGVAQDTYDNTANNSTLSQRMSFVGAYYQVVGKSGDAPTALNIGGEVQLVNEKFEVAATWDGFSLKAMLVDLYENGTLFAKIGSW